MEVVDGKEFEGSLVEGGERAAHGRGGLNGGEDLMNVPSSLGTEHGWVGGRVGGWAGSTVGRAGYRAGKRE